jgi:L-lactate dehydrogenase complex protein LldF
VRALDKAAPLTTASSLCGACDEVCPVKIPITAILRRLRDESYSTAADSAVPGHGCQQSLAERLAWKGWAFLNTHPRLNRMASGLLGVIGGYLPDAGPLARWNRFRTTPEFAPKSLHRLAREERISDE